MNNNTAQTNVKTARPRLSKHALSCALRNALDDAFDSGDYARIEAVHSIIEKESNGLDGLLRTIDNDPVDFILVASPGFSRELKLATGKSRNEWAALF
jgi:hypothetical protein